MSQSMNAAVRRSKLKASDLDPSNSVQKRLAPLEDGIKSGLRKASRSKNSKKTRNLSRRLAKSQISVGRA